MTKKLAICLKLKKVPFLDPNIPGTVRPAGLIFRVLARGRQGLPRVGLMDGCYARQDDGRFLKLQNFSVENDFFCENFKVPSRKSQKMTFLDRDISKTVWTSRSKLIVLIQLLVEMPKNVKLDSQSKQGGPKKIPKIVQIWSKKFPKNFWKKK